MKKHRTTQFIEWIIEDHFKERVELLVSVDMVAGDPLVGMPPSISIRGFEVLQNSGNVSLDEITEYVYNPLYESRICEVAVEQYNDEVEADQEAYYDYKMRSIKGD